MFCTNCGTRVKDGLRFCEKCGAPIEDEVVLEQEIPGEGAGVVEDRADPVGDAFVPKTGETAVLPVVSDANGTKASPEDGKKASANHVVIAIVSVIAILLALVVVFVWSGNRLQPLTTASVPPVSSNVASRSSSSAGSASSAKQSNAVTLTAYTTTGTRLSGIVRRDANDYVLPYSSSREYSMEELKSMDLTPPELCIAWNEPFAREGYHFGNKAIQEYFESTSWYVDKGIKPNVTGVGAKNNERLRELADQKGEGASKWKDLVLDNN